VANGNNDDDALPASVVAAEAKTANEDTKLRKTASGHDAGLQSGSTFGKTEKELKAQRDLELSGADPSLLGAEAETVYRDRKGKKLDMLNEFMRQQAVKAGKEVKLQQAQVEWGRGSVQKQEEVAAKQELEAIAAEPFARTVDKQRLEAMRKEVIRDGDPMAEYFMKKKEQDDEQQTKVAGGAGGSSSSSSIPVKPRKPRYKGPVGLPNRFGLLPGYRWDGVDRGNQYEHKILTRANDRAALKEDEYKWSVADM
jgi:pre-mRNA-splicing factor CWC26